MGLTTYDCVRAAIPDASTELCEHIIWERTPYPFAKLSARDFYRAASGFRRAGANGIRLCDWCRRPALDGWTCKPCDERLR